MSAPKTPLIDSMQAAVDAAPDDPVLRLHLGELLLDAGDGASAIPHFATVLQQDPDSDRAKALMTRALGSPAPQPQAPDESQTPAPASPEPASAPAQPAAAEAPTARQESQPPAAARPSPAQNQPTDSRPPTGFQRETAETAETAGADDHASRPAHHDGATPFDQSDFTPGRSRTTLADVAGMQPVKDRLEAAFLAPMRNAELRQAFGKSLRGGLLLYGPPGCGKTYIARAVSGEIGAEFISVSLADVLASGMGTSERNIQALFQQARDFKPCVVFLDELDSIGGRRNKVDSYLRNVVTQLLTELDSATEDNDDVFLLAATNHPWDVDGALRRPGRLDRTLFVPPPDEEARAAILTTEMRDRPMDHDVNAAALAERTEDLSGADLTHLCETAAEQALLDSARLGRVRPINAADFEQALAEVRPSTSDWFEGARAAVTFANKDNTYQDLAVYLNRRKNSRSRR